MKMSLSNGMKVFLNTADGCQATPPRIIADRRAAKATITAYHPGQTPGVGSWYEAEIAPGAVVALDPEDEGHSWDRDE